MEKNSFRPQTSVKNTEDEKPEALETALKIEWHQLPKEEECYQIIDQKVEERAYTMAKALTSALMEKFMQEGRSISPQLKEYILSDWYKTTQIEEVKEAKTAEPAKEEGHNASEEVRKDEEELKFYQETPAIVVGRNQTKRIINVAWGREQEGFFKWNFRTPLPNYNDTLTLDFEQRTLRGIMNVKRAFPLQGETGFQDNFYQIKEVSLEQNEAGEFSYEGNPLPTYLFGKQNISSLQAGDKVLVHWIYKFQPKDREFSWSIIKVEVPNNQTTTAKVEETQEETKQAQETPQAEVVAKLPQEEAQEPNNPTQATTQEEQEHADVFTETHTLIINDIPLRNGELTCRCLTNQNELIYFRKSLTEMEINRLDKLIITGLVRHEAFGKQFIKITEIRLAEDKDFPETILRKRVRRLRKEGNNIFLDDEQLAARKVQLLRLKHLMMRAGSDDLSVLVEEMFLYAVHIKDYEWTIASVKAVKAETEEADVTPIVEQDEDLSPTEKQKQQEALRQPWQVRVAYITKVNQELGRVEIVYGIKKKGYIALEDFPITSPYEGDWLGMKMLDGKEPMHEIVFHDVIRLDPNKRLPNTSKLIYKVRRGVLWFSEQDHCFKLHNAPISQELVLAMDSPKYKDYFLVEELLDYNEALGDFAWRPIKVEKFEYLEPAEEMEGHIYPQKFRQEEAFHKALANLEAIAPKLRKEEKPTAKQGEESPKTKAVETAQIPTAMPTAKEVVAEPKAEKPVAKQEENAITPQEAITINKALVSFCPQGVSKHRRKKEQSRARGVKGLRAKKKQA